MKEANIFEAWADRLVEGTWSTPDSPQAQQKLLELMSKELPVGADATNATEQLYDLLGDDKLFDLLESLAQQDPNADCRQVILDRMQELSDNPDVRAVLEQLNIDADATMNPPESMPADLGDQEQAMAEGSDHSLKKVFDRYARHLSASRGDTSDVDQMMRSSKVLKDITKYVRDNYGEDAVDNMERYANQQPYVTEDAVQSLRRAAGLTEGRMLDEDKSKLDHILDRFKYEVRNFEQGGDLDDDLYDALFDYYMDTGDMPYGTAKARDGDPYEWVAQNLESHLRGGGIIGGVPDEDYSLERESVGDYASEEIRASHSVDGGMDNSILYDDSTCNMSEAGEPCPTHGLEECWTESTVPAPMEEKSPLAGIYGHSGKMQEVGKDTSFLDRLKTLSGMAKS